jgi:hypothetical protein
MQHLRAFLFRHRALAFVVLMAALAMKVALPAGFMFERDSTVITVKICGDAMGGAAERQMVIPVKDADESGGQHGKQAGSQCPYAALTMAALAGADAALLALALVYILALAFAPVLPARLARNFHLRPPLRGPPAPG